MLMDRVPNQTLPLYDATCSCSQCGRREIRRVEVYHPHLGLVLVCALCAVVIRAIE